MKQPSYADHAITGATKLLGFESNSPQQTFNYPALGAFVPFIPSTAKQFIGTIQQTGFINGPILIPMTGTSNQIGEVQDSMRLSQGEFVIEFEAGTFSSGTLYAFVGASGTSGSSPTLLQISIDTLDVNDSKIKINNFDIVTQANVDSMNFPLHLILI